MSLSRRKLITTGLAAAAGIAGLSAADRIGRRYGLIPPDSGGIYGPGETLTYAAQRLLTRHSLAREFPREHEPCPIGSDRALDTALITAPEARDPELLKKLDAVAGRVLRTKPATEIGVP